MARMNEPLVSVVMPVYNGALYIQQSMVSILKQTYTNFEFIIVDDGSTDHTLSIIKANNDTRIHLVQLHFNNGIVNALNTGIKLAKGKYIARMDADDIALPERLANQVDFLEKHEEVGLLGTQYKAIGARSRKFPLIHNDLVWYMFNACPFIHASVMIRKSVLDKHNLSYDKQFEYAEDLALWVKLSNVTQIANLPEVALKYRVHQATHFQTKNISIQHNHTIKLQLIEQYLKGLNSQQQNELAGILNQVKLHEYSLDYFQHIIQLLDLVIKNGNANFIPTANRCLWFHAASAPALFFGCKKQLRVLTWLHINKKQYLWLFIKSIIKP